ncbi:kinase-like protein [Alternaria alternata]|uniref:non-specific serine/threonine protein kinase n=1 Tax=Alternaria alternata TaxID=5599 RepID=A0A177DAZ6_ALTAL|nr:kinase-like protein [Alternaria alternata]OAG16638.1 kinase-like protein [Alternaria alternata]
MANNPDPRVVNIGGIETYESIDDDDANLYDGLLDNQTKNAFLAMMRYLIRKRDREFPRGSRGRKVVSQWGVKQNYWRKKVYTGQPAVTAVRPLPIPPPIAPPMALQVPVASVDHAQVAQQQSQESGATGDAPEGDGVDTPTTISETSSGERSPPFYIRNSPERKRFLAPTAGQRREAYNHQDGNWKFAMTLYQTRLDGSGADKRRFEKGTMPRKSVSLYVRTSDAGVVEDQITVKCLEALDAKEFNDAKHEIRMNQRISQLSCSHMIPQRGSTRRSCTRKIHGRSNDEEPVPTVFNIYSSFAELGTLARIYNGHKLTPKKKPVPEHFIWYLLSQMSKALIALQQGVCSTPNLEDQNQDHKSPIGSGEDVDSDATSVAWRPIIHSDIKDANIFLRSNNTQYPAYPRVVLSDFDIAFELDDEREMQIRQVQGTPGLMPPERDGAGLYEDDWKPDDWPISEKSDIWSLAMTAWALMMAHKEESFYENVQERSKDPEHVKDLRNGTVGSTDSIFPQTLEEIPQEYSVRLCQVISRCLRYNPERRMSLEKLRRVSDDNLSRLDRMYGEEIRKGKDAIADEFKLEYTNEDSDEWAQYAIGQEFVPPRKRRKTDSAGEFEERLTSLLIDWASEAIYPRPSTEVQDEVLKHVDNLISSSSEKAIEIFREREAYLTAWQYLCSSIGRYTSSQRDVYVATDITIEVLQESLERNTKREVLMLLRETVLELALEAASGDQKTGLYALQHVVMWGLVLLEINAEPVTPRLGDKTEMHRGMASFILDQPSGVPVHEDADPDVSIT